MEALDSTDVQLPAMRHDLSGLRRLAARLPERGLLVEIGSFAGESTRVFLEAGLRVHAIDPWDNAARDRLHEGARDFNPAHRWGFEMQVVEQRFDRLLEPFAGQLKKCKGYDWQYVDAYAPASLDAVYVDSIHTYADVLASIQRWKSKVKPGGFVCGHDFADYFPGVPRAVREALGEPHQTFEDTSWLVQL